MAQSEASHRKNVEAFGQLSGLPESNVSERLRTFRVAVDVATALTDGSDEWVQAYVLLNLLPRVFDNVAVHGCDPKTMLPPSHCGRFKTFSSAEADVVIALGEIGPAPSGKTIFVTNRGWVAYVGRDRQWAEPLVPRNPIAAYYAGALAVGEVFKLAFPSSLLRSEQITGSYGFDVYNMVPATEPVLQPDLALTHWDVLDMLVVGIGAVGQAFLDALSLVTGLSGGIHLVDPDHSDDGNEQRCVFAYPDMRNQMKVDIATRILKMRHPFLQVRRNQSIFSKTTVSTVVDAENQTIGFEQTVAFPLRQDYSHFRQTIGSARPYPLVVCAVDSAKVRRDIQFGLHKVVFNGWTETGAGRLNYGIGRHRISDKACMACRYHPDSNSNPSFEDFVRSRTGWAREKVERYLRDDHLLLSREDTAEIATLRRIPPQSLDGMVGRSLRSGVHEECGAFQVTGSQQPAPVPHLAALTGALLASAVIRELRGEGEKLHLFQTDAQKCPTKYSKRTEPPNENCLCRDSDVQAVYQASWGPEAV